MNKKAFTLIELLVVIVIVGILSGLVFVQMNGAIGAAQDSRRKTDISTLRKALLNYSVFHGNTYPIADCSINSSCTALYNALVPEYIPALPADPISGNYYTYKSTSGTSFNISAVLSNSTAYSYDSIAGFSSSAMVIVGPSGYSRRAPITVANSSGGALTNYQALVTVAYDSDMKANFDDLVFTSSDGSTVLPYWIESYTASSTARVWVKVPSLATGSNTIYMYYGNSSAVASSNASNTLEFFDDFNTGTSPSSHWSVKSGTWALSSGALYQSAQPDSFLPILTDYTGTNYIIESDVQILDEYENNLGALLVARSASTTVSSSSYYGGFYRVYGTGAKNVYLTSNGMTSYAYTFGTWYQLKFAVYDNNQKVYVNNSLISSGTASTYASGFAGVATQACHAKFDNFRIRKYASVEPTSSLGSEQTSW